MFISQPHQAGSPLGLSSGIICPHVMTASLSQHCSESGQEKNDIAVNHCKAIPRCLPEGLERLAELRNGWKVFRRITHWLHTSSTLLLSR